MNRKLIAFLSCLIVVIIGGVAIYYVMTMNDSDLDRYRKKLSSAQKYVQEENWDDAIVAYLEAIEIDDTDEDSYYTLAQIYYYTNRIDDARDILLKGIDITKSQKLQDLYDEYFTTTGTEIENNEDESKDKDVEEKIELNITLLKRIASFNLSQYEQKYGSAEYNKGTDICIVSHSKLKNVEFEYFNTDENNNILDSTTGVPLENRMPGLVTFKDLSVLFAGANEKITAEETEELNLRNIKYTKDQKLGKNIVEFSEKNCKVRIEVDDDKNILLDAWNEVVPLEANKDISDVVEVKGMVVSATTGKGVEDAKIYVREQGDTTGNVITTFETNNKGEYTAEIEPGEYTAEVDRESYIKEYIDFNVDKWGETDTSQFVISESLADGEIRIVLEWGQFPTDLDSHLFAKIEGRKQHVFFRHKDIDSANLDVDDTTSYGPETITILNGGTGEFTYYVHDYTFSNNIGASGAVVKVYLPGKNQPIVYNIDEDLGGNEWGVFSIKDGKIVDLIETDPEFLD